MTKSYEEKPDTWAAWGEYEILHAGGDIYYTIIADGIEVGGKATNVWVWHWHMPTVPDKEGNPIPPRWQLSGCGLHTVVQVDPLTLVASLACEDGCPSHGWLTDGVWRPC